MNRIVEFPLLNNEAFEMHPEFRKDPYLMAAKLYESNKQTRETRAGKQHIYGNKLNLNTELPINSKRY